MDHFSWSKHGMKEQKVGSFILGILINHCNDLLLTKKKLWIRTRVGFFVVAELRWQKYWEPVGYLPCELVCWMNCQPVSPKQRAGELWYFRNWNLEESLSVDPHPFILPTQCGKKVETRKMRVTLGASRFFWNLLPTPPATSCREDQSRRWMAARILEVRLITSDTTSTIYLEGVIRIEWPFPNQKFFWHRFRYLVFRGGLQLKPKFKCIYLCRIHCFSRMIGRESFRFHNELQPFLYIRMWRIVSSEG